MAAMLYPERHVLAVSGDGELAGDGNRLNL
jgi:hypothetical protein